MADLSNVTQIQKGFIYNDQCAMLGDKQVIGFGNKDFHIKTIDRKLAIDIIIANHYSKKVYNNSYIHLGVFINNEIVGVLQFGHLLNNLSVSNIVEGTKAGEALELNRMWLSDIAPRNSESKALSYCIKYIKHNYRHIQWVQSFADERCGCFGIVYQACSFGYYGEHKSKFYEIDGEFYHKILLTNNSKRASHSEKAQRLKAMKDTAPTHTFRQFRYILFFSPKIKEKCLLKQCDYPKHYSQV